MSGTRRISSLLRASRAVPPLATGLTFAVGSSLRPSTACAGFSTSPQAAVASAASNTAPTIVLYQYAACPFCNKVRAYLDYAKLPYLVVEVDPLLKREIAWSKDYKKVPIAVVNGKAVRDSGPIIDAIDALLRPAATSKATGSAAAVAGPLTRVASGSASEAQWRTWVDNVLVKHLTCNIYRTWEEAFATFDYLTSRNFPAWSALASKYAGGAAMVMVARKRAQQLGTPKGGEREALYAVLNEFAAAVEATGQPFIGGARPDLADVSVFGALRSIEGLATWQDMMAHSGIRPWYERMAGAVGPSSLVHRIGEAPHLE